MRGSIANAPLSPALPLALVALTVAGAARADPPPRGLEIHWPSDGAGPVLVTNRGLVFVDPDEQRFRLMCNRALDVGSAIGDEPKLAYLGSGMWMAATYAGLKTTSDRGCTWSSVEQLGELGAPALAQAGPATIWVATYGVGQSAIRVTRDAGATWTTAIALADTDFTHSIVLSTSNPLRLYAAGIDSSDSAGLRHYLLRSSDGGASWERLPVDLSSIDERATVVAVHPHDEDEVVLVTTSVSPDLYAGRVLLSRDAGQSYSSTFEAQDIRDVAYASDGAELWVADYDGVSVSSDRLVSFEPRGAAEWTSCVIEHDDRLWVCGQLEGSAATASGVGVSADGARTFSNWLDFRDIVEPVDCPGESATHVTCEAAWAHWQVEVLGLDPPTAVDDAGADARVGIGGGSSTGTGGSPMPTGGTGGFTASDGGAPGGAGTPAARTKEHDDGWCTVAIEHRPARWQAFVALLAAYFFRRAARARRD